eukprot:TRINITY_DN2711_c0_g1_i1.p1 TRINITY_DN2711_c0_g1~~TRINITY_DN2711_c0_g1_i1.p1  ORF type:complete len:193 (+),score=40.92 TRINITY_DN2711_c0_g1_i1:35-613(+)
MGIINSLIGQTPTPDPSPSNIKPNIYKIIQLGDIYVGKTTIVKQYFNLPLDDRFGVDFQVKKLEVGEETVSVQVWDYMPRSDFYSVSHLYIRRADGVFFVYDVGNEDSFRNIDRWYTELERFGTDPLPEILLIANKTDLKERKISREDGMGLANRLNCKYFEMSAIQDNETINEVFDVMIDAITKARDPKFQ